MDASSEQTRSARTRPTRAGVAAIAVAVAFLTAGCGAVAHLTAANDRETAMRGKALFKQPTIDGKPGCGSCHTMVDAGTTGIVGPNLDDIFGIVRSQGFDESTIRDVVRGQIAYPETQTVTGSPGMPANLLVGQDARDVADYVATCAGPDAASTPNCKSR